MNLPDTRFRSNQPEVVSESLEDELVIVNLESGNYYSVNAMGAVIWGCVEQGATIVETLQTLSAAYQAPQAEMELAISRFVDDLLQNKLIVPSERDTPCEAKLSSHPEGMQPFEAPKLNIYSDLQDLLLLDPIHEVDETGWPSIDSESN